MKLTAAEVHRSGRTARTWNYETDGVELDNEKGEEAICLAFCLSSKGGGVTEVKVTVGAGDFAAIISAMTSADRECTMREMASALATEIANQPDYNKKITHEARESVAHAAANAYSEAPAGHDHAERLVNDVVQQLVDELNNADEETGVSSEHTPLPNEG